MFRTLTQLELGDRVMKRVIIPTFIFSLCIFPLASVCAVDVRSLNGRYNSVLFGSDHGREFTSGIGYVDFDGAGNWSGEVTKVSQGQSTGAAFDVGPSSGTYSVSPAGKLTLSNYDNGHISTEGSLIVWAPIPGDIPYEEAGINVGIKQGTGMGTETLNGTYNMVLFSANHATEFSSGIGYLNFDGDGSFTFDINKVSHGQSTGEAFGIETSIGTYSVDPNGELVLFSDKSEFTGYISADGSLAVWATTPGDIASKETGIGVAIKQGSGMSVESLNGEYNVAWFWSSRSSGFHSSIGHFDFDGAGNWTGEVTNVSPAQNENAGDAPSAEPFGGKYSVSPTGRLTLDNIDNGHISEDGSVLVWAPVPGDVSDKEVGITIAIKKPTSFLDLTGEYWFGSLSADADSWVPWSEQGEIIIDGNNWYQEWDDDDGHHSFSSTFTTSVQPDGSININHAWGSYNVAWNGNIMIHADTAPNAENRLGFDIIARKATNVHVNDLIGNYSFFGHWLGWYERYGSVGWGSLEFLADGNAIATWVEEDGHEKSETVTWILDDVNGIIDVSIEPDAFLCEGGIISSFRSNPDIGGDLGYNFFVKQSNESITPDDIAGTYAVRFLETSVFGQPFTCGKGTAVFRPDGTFSVDAYYSGGEHDVFDANYTVGPGNRITFPGSEHEEEGIISPDKSFIFAPELQVPAEPEWWDWIGGIFLIRTVYNTSDLN